MKSMSIKKAVTFFRFFGLIRHTDPEKFKLGAIAARTLMGAFRKKFKKSTTLAEAYYHFAKKVPY